MIDKERLAKEYVWVHENTTTMSGRTTVNNKDRIKEVIDRVNPVNVLDFGCGKGWQYTRQNMHEYWGIEKPVLYDPYVAKYNKLAGYRNRYFDLVLCVDVMEHIQEDKVDEVLEDLFNSGRHIFLTITCYPATQILPNGKNAHYTVKEPSWWNEKLAKYDGKYTVRFQEKAERSKMVRNPDPGEKDGKNS